MARHEAATHPPHLLAPAPRRPIQLVRAFRSATAPTAASSSHHHPYLQHSTTYVWDASLLPRRSSTTRPIHSPPSTCSSAASQTAPSSRPDSPPHLRPSNSHPRSQSERTGDSGVLDSSTAPSWRAKGGEVEDGSLPKVARMSLTDNGVGSNAPHFVTPLAECNEATPTKTLAHQTHDPDLTPTRKQLQGMSVAAAAAKQADEPAQAAPVSGSAPAPAPPSEGLASPEMRPSSMLIPPSPISRLHTRNPFERQMQRLVAHGNDVVVPEWASYGDEAMEECDEEEAAPEERERISVRSLRGMDRLDVNLPLRNEVSPEIETPTQDGR